jgi:hypothetical protein
MQGLPVNGGKDTDFLGESRKKEEADDGARTHDLLHGNSPRHVRAASQTAFLSQIIPDGMRLDEPELGRLGRKFGRKSASQ